MKKIATETLRKQFDSTLYMAKVLVEVCPDKVWSAVFNGVPFWQQVFHYTWFIDFWMREEYTDYDSDDWQVMNFSPEYTPDLDKESYAGQLIPREVMSAYLKAIQAKTTRVFDALNDEKLNTPVFSSGPPHTYTDVIMGQIRHIMYNIGYLNGILRTLGLPESDWYAYNEPEDA